MANKRIKDISTTATSAAADDFVCIDGSANGTRKISAGPLDGNFVDNIVVENGGNKTTYATNFLRSENSSYYIDAYNVGGDILFRTSVASAVDTTSMVIDGATGNIGIGSTGGSNKLTVVSAEATTPQVLVQNSTSTGDAALSFNVSGRTFSLGIDKSDSEKFKISRSSALGTTDYVTIDGGKVGIGNSSPGDYFSNANALVVGTGADAHQGITIATNSDGGGHLYFMDGVANAPGRISYYHTGNNMLFYTNDSERMRLTSDGHLGISNSSPDHPLTLTANPGAANTPVAWLHNSGNVSEYDGTVISTVNDGSDVEVLHVRTNTTTYDGGSSLMLVKGDGNVGIGVDPGSTKLRVSGGSGQLFKIDDGANALLTCDATGNLDVASGVTTLNNTGDNALRVESTDGNPMTVNVVGSAPNYLFDVRDDGTSKFRVDGSGNLSLETGEYQSGNSLVISADPNNDGSASKIELKVDGTTRVEVTNSGNLNIANGNLGFATSGKGIDFSATSDGTGSSISELFSDYEQGDFVPVIGTSGGTIDGTTTIHSAKYTKIGNTVHLSINVSTNGLTDISAASGYVRITGLPFTAAGSSTYGGLFTSYALNWSNHPVGGYVNTSSTIVSLTKRFSSITGYISTMAASDLNTSGGDKNDLIINGFYHTA